jgi:Acyl-CoA dehydrogenase, C-terminal domain
MAVCICSLAIARGAIAALRELADRKTPLGSMKTMRHRPAVQFALADAEAQLRAARLLFYETLNATWQRALASELVTLEQRADLMLACAHAVRTSAHVADFDASDGWFERDLRAKPPRATFPRCADGATPWVPVRESPGNGRSLGLWRSE